MITRNEMIERLLNAEKYSLGASYSPKSLTRNIKIYNLDLTEDQEEKAYNLLSSDVDLINYLINKYSDMLLDKTNRRYELDVRGRSGGHIVMVGVEFNDDGSKTYINNGFLNGFIDEEDFEDWEDYEVEEAYNTMLIFNDVVDKLIDEFKEILNYCEVTLLLFQVFLRGNYL